MKGKRTTIQGSKVDSTYVDVARSHSYNLRSRGCPYVAEL